MLKLMLIIFVAVTTVPTVVQAQETEESTQVSAMKKMIAIQQAQIANLVQNLKSHEQTIDALAEKVEGLDANGVTKADLNQKLSSYATKSQVNSSLKSALRSYAKCGRRVSLVTSSGKYQVSTTTDRDIIKAIRKDDSKARQVMTLRCR